MLSYSYILNKSVTIQGKPFHGGGIDHVTLHPGQPGSGIQFRFQGKDYPLQGQLIQATKQRTARFNQAVFDTFKVKVLEHWQSAIIQALGFDADVIIELPKPKLFYDKSVLLPYAGGGILEPYSALVQHRQCVPKNTGKTISIDWNEVCTHATSTADGIVESVDKDSCSIMFTHPTNAKLRVSTHPHLRTTVHSALHPDVPALKQLDSKPYSTDYTNLTAPELSARALGRTGKLHQRLGANVLRATGGYGISSEGYFFANPGTTAQTLRNSMQIAFQNNANEHLAHSAIADIPAELRLLTKHFQADHIGLHVEFRDSTHISRVALLRALCEAPYTKTTTTKSIGSVLVS